MNTDHLIRQVTREDLDRCHAIERAAYEGEEAATREKIARRIRAYPDGFIVLEHEGLLAGFINFGIIMYTTDFARRSVKQYDWQQDLNCAATTLKVLAENFEVELAPG